MPRVAICAPSTPLGADLAERLLALAAAEFPGVELHVHPQCFMADGHFAGDDVARLAALLDCANDPGFDAVWFARGGYGACRIAEDALARLGPAARSKCYLGYSDAGYLLAGLYRARLGTPVHAPMPGDLRRPDGEAAIRRVLGYVSGGGTGIERGLDERPAVAFNLTTLAMLCGTPLLPDLTGHVVLIEEVSEHLYAIDRLLFHVTAQLAGIAGLRLGRISEVPANDRPFGSGAEAIARHWCARHGIDFLGTADIGHDGANAIVPFGLAGARQPQ